MPSTGVFLLASFLSSLAAVLLAVGCASQTNGKTTSKPRPGSRIAEYRQATGKAQKAVDTALEVLATVSTQSNGCPPNVLSNFSAEVRQLQVGSVQMRARTEAMQARGDAYFQHWRQNMEQVQDPQVRALAEQNKPHLQQSFDQIKQLSQEGRAAFQPFITALRKLRNALEKDPQSLTRAEAQNWVSSARENGERVRQCLVGVEHELDSMTAMITPPGKSAP